MEAKITSGSLVCSCSFTFKIVFLLFFPLFSYPSPSRQPLFIFASLFSSSSRVLSLRHSFTPPPTASLILKIPLISVFSSFSPLLLPPPGRLPPALVMSQCLGNAARICQHDVGFFSLVLLSLFVDFSRFSLHWSSRLRNSVI